MAKPVNDDSDTDIDVEDEGGSTFDRMLEKLTEKESKGMDVNMLLQMRQDERRDRERDRERREAKESRQFTITTVIGLLAPVLPALVEKIFGEKKNEMMAHYMDLIKDMLTKDKSSGSAKEMLDMVMNVNKATLEGAVDQLKSIGQLKEEMLRDQIEELKQKKEDETNPSENPIVAGMREARMLFAATGLQLGGAKTEAKGPAISDPVPAKLTGGEPAPADQPATTAPAAAKPAPLAILVQALKSLHAEGDKMTLQQRAKIRTSLTAVCLNDEKLTKAIIEADQDTLVSMGTPLFTADPKLMAWISTPGVQEWMNAYLEKQLAPMLDEAMNGEQYANEKDDEDGNDGEEPPDTTPTPE